MIVPLRWLVVPVAALLLHYLVATEATRFIRKLLTASTAENAPLFPETYDIPPTLVQDVPKDTKDAFEHARKIVAEMTLIEKVNLTSGTGWQMGPCVGQTSAVSRFSIPAICCMDSPLGIRPARWVTGFPPGVTTASTWNKQLIHMRGKALGKEFRGKGANVYLGPVAGPLGRNPEAGRNWEAFSVDPYLTGICMAETIEAVQDQGVIACAKHFVGNEQESFRLVEEDYLPIKQPLSQVKKLNQSISANIDDRTLHEVYMWPFADAIRAGVGSIMCSYNPVNNTYACENSKLMNGLLKQELGFDGFVMSDWYATMSLAFNTGLDVDMPGSRTSKTLCSSFFGANLTKAIVDGQISVERLEDAAVRILTQYFKMKQEQIFPKTNLNCWDLHKVGKIYYRADNSPTGVINEDLDVRSNHSEIARQLAIEGTVLLKNKNHALPLKRDSSKSQAIALIGNDAGPRREGLIPDDWLLYTNGVLPMGSGSGTVLLPHLITPLDTVQSRAVSEGYIVDYILDNWKEDSSGYTASLADTSIVFINSPSGEGISLEAHGYLGDRDNLSAIDNGDQLVLTVAGNCSNTIVVVHAVGPILMNKWIDHPNVTAVIWANLPGEAAGTAIEAVLFGDENPSGKLVYTIAKHGEDYLNHVQQYTTSARPQVDYKEGLNIDYRRFDSENIIPLFEFGFGLSYTTFKYSDIGSKKITDLPYVPCRTTTEPISVKKRNFSPFDYQMPNSIRPIQNYLYTYINKGEEMKNFGPVPLAGKTPVNVKSCGRGGNPSLFEIAYEVSATVTNTGDVAGKEAAQLYIQYPDSAKAPPKQLRGFEKVDLQPGESKTVIFKIRRKDMMIWDILAQDWRLPEGEFKVFVGASSRDLPLQLTL